MTGALAGGQTARADDHWCDGERRGTRLSITSGTVSIGTHVEVSDLVIVNDDDSQTSGDLFLSIIASQNPEGRRGYYLLDVEDSHPNRDVLLRLRWISNREPIQLDPGGSTRIRFRSALREVPPGAYGRPSLRVEQFAAGQRRPLLRGCLGLRAAGHLRRGGRPRRHPLDGH